MNENTRIAFLEKEAGEHQISKQLGIRKKRERMEIIEHW